MTSSELRFIAPGARIGIVGGGQLGQMLALSAQEMGYRVTVVDPDPACPASFVADQIVADYDDQEALTALAEQCDVLTFEFENVSARTLTEAGGYLPQGVSALEICQDRTREKAFLTSAGVPVAPFRVVNDSSDLAQATTEIGFPCVVKTATGGYDGKGQVVVKSEADLPQAEELLGHTCVVEQWIPFDKEISVIVVGDGHGEYHAYPVGENVHQNNILYTTTVPASIGDEVAVHAQELALRIAAEISLVGVMGVEMFVADGDQLFVNELAPRPHNSGHYTIEACDVSQFDAHIRAVCGLPLKEPVLLSAAVMTNVLGEDLPGFLEGIACNPSWSVHLYGKSEARKGRKMGHMTELIGA